MNPPIAHTSLVRIDALAAADGDGFFAAPASVIVRLSEGPDAAGWHARVVAAGRAADVDLHPAAKGSGLRTISRPRSMLIPGLVNAHTHLDLTHLGPREHDPAAGFVAWIGMIRAGRRVEDAGIGASVEAGLRLSAAAGTVAIGDIAGAARGRPTLAPWRALASTGMRGVSYLEFFGIGQTVARSWALVPEALAAGEGEAAVPGRGPRLGLSPHATTTVSRSLFLRAARLAEGRPLCTHAAETPEEREFIAHARGPQRELLERLGVWEASILDEIGHGRHPIAHLAELIAERPVTVVHVNDATDEAIEILGRGRASVVYCPHASAYFAAEGHFGPHRYQEMLGAGINVALGTDSVVNLPPGSDRMPSADQLLEAASGMSIWREVCLLHRRDGVDPTVLLRMATVGGARALDMDQGPFAFRDGEPLAGLLAIALPGVDEVGTASGGLRAAIAGGRSPEVLFADNYSGLAGILGDPMG